MKDHRMVKVQLGNELVKVSSEHIARPGIVVIVFTDYRHSKLVVSN